MHKLENTVSPMALKIYMTLPKPAISSRCNSCDEKLVEWPNSQRQEVSAKGVIMFLSEILQETPHGTFV